MTIGDATPHRQPSHCGILEMSIIHTSPGGGSVLQTHDACRSRPSLNVCEVLMLMEIHLVKPPSTEGFIDLATSRSFGHNSQAPNWLEALMDVDG